MAFPGLGIVGLIAKGVGAIAGIFKDKADGKINDTDAAVAVEKVRASLTSQVEETVQLEMEAKKSVIVAELQQGDKYTKRARPSIIYFGLLAASAEAVLKAVAVFGGLPEDVILPASFLPTIFWGAWGGVASTWVIGRSVERRGASNAAGRAAIAVSHAIGRF